MMYVTLDVVVISSSGERSCSAAWQKRALIPCNSSAGKDGGQLRRDRELCIQWRRCWQWDGRRELHAETSEDEAQQDLRSVWRSSAGIQLQCCHLWILQGFLSQKCIQRNSKLVIVSAILNAVWNFQTVIASIKLWLCLFVVVWMNHWFAKSDIVQGVCVCVCVFVCKWCLKKKRKKLVWSLLVYSTWNTALSFFFKKNNRI